MRDVFVTNRNKFHHADRFDGEDYDFPPGERQQVPVEAAVHMLGFGLADKSDVLTRLGWNIKYGKDPETGARIVIDDSDEGAKKLAKFVFTKGVMVEEKVDAPDQVAA